MQEIVNQINSYVWSPALIYLAPWHWPVLFGTDSLRASSIIPRDDKPAFLEQGI